MPIEVWIGLGVLALFGVLWFAYILVSGDKRFIEHVADDYDPDPAWRKQPDVPVQAVGDKGWMPPEYRPAQPGDHVHYDDATRGPMTRVRRVAVVDPNEDVNVLRTGGRLRAPDSPDRLQGYDPMRRREHRRSFY